MRRVVLGPLNKLTRAIWNVVWLFFYRPSPVYFHFWRRFLLRCFGASICARALPYPSAKIWAPWNLTMRDYSCLSHHVDCYCVDKVFLGERVTVSQYSFLCTAGHDYSDSAMPLITAPIQIEADAWVTADVFVGPGVTIGQGAVVLARSTVVKNVPAWTVVGGNPCRNLRQRVIRV